MRRALVAVMLLASAARLAGQSPLPPARDAGALRTPSIVERATLDTSAVVNFRVLVQPETLYVGQQATYQLGVFLDESVRDRLRRMEALAPEMRAMMAYDPPAPLAGFPLRIAGAHRYEAHVYQRPIFPLSAGRFAIPPARLVYAMPLSYSFFSREESFELRSDSAIVIAIDPPAAGRPVEYGGAVGVLRAVARVDTSAARVGDPVRLTLRVTGQANVKLLPRPSLTIVGMTAVPAGERVMLAPDSLVVQGTKEFDWVLTPERAGALEIPSIRYAFFDPYARRYEVAQTVPETLSVSPGALVRIDTSVPRPRWLARTTYRGPLAVPLQQRGPFRVAMLLVPLPALAMMLTRLPRRRKRRISRAATLRALTRRSDADLRTIRRAFLLAIAERVRLPATSIAEPTQLSRACRRAGTSSTTAARAAALLAELNAAAFSADGGAVADAAARAWQLYLAVDAEARRYRTPAPLALALLVALALAASASALTPDAERALFARGLDAYEHARYVLAERDFAALAAQTPRAPDAWANLGTAAFMAGDTVQATIGWERALRLEPLAADVRDRLELLSPASGNGPGAVAPIPTLPLAIVAALLWCGAWLALAWQLRPPPGPRRAVRVGTAPAVLVAVAFVALALGAGVTTLDRRNAASDLVVLTREASLRLFPVLAAERGAALRTGEVARVLAHDGAWAHVVADGGRDGWIDAGALAPLVRD